MIRLLNELDGLTNDPPRFNKRLGRVDELRTKVQQESRAYMIVNSFTQLAELRRYSADRRIGASDVDDAELAKRQIARDIEFMTAVRDGALEIRPILRDALDRVSRADNSA